MKYHPSDRGQSEPPPDGRRPGPEEPENDTKASRENPPRSLDRLESFEGCWTSEPGFTFPWSKGSSFHYYCFDRSGSARSYSAMLGGSGRVASDCHFTSEVTVNPQGFVLVENASGCPGWEPGVYDCRLKAPGVASCDVEIAGHNVPIELYYQGMSVPELKPPGGAR
jgi:hypothetical protein